ncbi:GntR family transcriptional regulator [Dehalobacter sp. DCM]|uniref:GntR family transcriptional regulator n=1 Tax=Dehalobacter sp. DCM TaxID=2907827 RepID=UPI0030812EC5|nr:GntR family transcriptional regulator [Dehalobacter sp. DCM]
MEQARYQEIAYEIAHAVVLGEYHEGDKIHGRSTLAGRFNVSPETIRRAIAILQSEGVVEVKQGSGIVVVSRTEAEKFLKSFDQKNEIQAFMDELKSLMDKRKEIDKQIDTLLQKVSTYADRFITRWNDVQEIEIPQDSAAVGSTLTELKVREKTGATVVGVVRNGVENFSPGADFLLDAGDILLLVLNSEEGRKKIQTLLKKGVKKRL